MAVSGLQTLLESEGREAGQHFERRHDREGLRVAEVGQDAQGGPADGRYTAGSSALIPWATLLNFAKLLRKGVAVTINSDTVTHHGWHDNFAGGTIPIDLAKAQQAIRALADLKACVATAAQNQDALLFRLLPPPG